MAACLTATQIPIASGPSPMHHLPMPRSKASKSAAVPAATTQRGLRVGEMVRHTLAELLARGDIHDEVLQSHVISISEVKLSTDLKLATCYVMPLGGTGTREVLEALNRHKRFIRGEISHKVNLKFAPEVRFLADDTFNEATRIDQLLQSPEVLRDLEKKD